MSGGKFLYGLQGTMRYKNNTEMNTSINLDCWRLLCKLPEAWMVTHKVPVPAALSTIPLWKVL
jgi:hypothetical protein